MRGTLLYNAPSEKDIHLSICQMLRVHPKFKNLLWWHCPNGASFGKDRKRAAIQGNLLKRQGMLPGVPDLFFPSLNLFVEIKTATGKCSPSQVEVMKRLEDCGYTCLVVRGVAPLLDILINILSKDEQPNADRRLQIQA